MAEDTYTGFEELARREKAGRDFQIALSDRGSAATVIAPHGGKIEPHTSEIARHIAAEAFNCYCFEGIKKCGNAALHITSHRFDEPGGVGLVARSQRVVAVHACIGPAATVFLGGRDLELMRRIGAELKARGIRVASDPRFAGRRPQNICNRSLCGKGVQLEIARDLRDDPAMRAKIAEAVQVALELVLQDGG